MALKKIVVVGDPVLRKISEPVTEFNAKLHKLIDVMTNVLYGDDGRAGLAAPQIGVLKQVVVMDCGDGLIEMVNPYIIETKGRQTGEEGCLSVPNHHGIVRRAQYVKAGFFDRDGEEYTIEAEDFLARCILHETDHLKGILYIDHIAGGKFYKDDTGEDADIDEIIKLSGK